MAKQLGFYINSAACTNCRACAIACKDKNNTVVGVNFRRVFVYGGGSWLYQGGFMQPVNVYNYSVSLGCQHCVDPACMAACPTGAIHKDAQGIVTVEASQCIGCRYCEWACPYGTPQFDAATGVMSKCDFCQDLVAQGQNPACVDACPMRALEYGELSELQAKYGTAAAVEPLPSAALTHPSIVITPHRHAQLSGEGHGRILDLEKEV
jgi:anaerobic dimethyl sulfoxide reductase subunit B (iron-sulfur subunit)